LRFFYPTKREDLVTKKEIGRKFDNDKLRYDLLDPFFEEAVVDVLTHGAKKYEDNNWKSVEPFYDRYYAALRRHILAWRKGEKIDPDSGRPHLAHALCNIYFLMWKDIEIKKAP
jgi:hypothetical protein